MEEKNTRVVHKRIAGIGYRYTIFGFAIFLMEHISSTLLRHFAPALLDKYYAMTSFVMTIVIIYMIGFPLICLLTKKLDREQLPKSKFGTGKYIQGIFICAGICGAGGLIGGILNALCTLPFGINPNDGVAVTKLVLESNFFMRVFTVGILAPIFEELIFRKVLVDHLANYSKMFAILASGVMFGLFHGNFSQGVFATGLGMFFAYIYVKTGNIKYSIGYHMIINCTTSIVTTELAKMYMSIGTEENLRAIEAGDQALMMSLMVATVLLLAWMGFLILCVLVGLVLLITHFVKKDFKVIEKEDALAKAEAVKAVFVNPGMLTFYVYILIRFLENYMLPILK